MAALPSLFLSHGAPMVLVDGSAAQIFLKNLPARLNDAPVRGIVVLTAHWESDVPCISAGGRPGTIHDFYGFPDALYEVTYPAPGDPALAGEIAGLLKQQGIDTVPDGERGFDHGTWIPLALMYPDADIPVVQLSVMPAKDPEYHFRLGAALRPLRESGVLLIGSGSMTHNLSEYRRYMERNQAPGWVDEFADGVWRLLETRDDETLFDYERSLPHARRNHPSSDHFLPLFFALGAATPGEVPERIHRSTAYGVLRMDAVAFS